MEFHYGFTTLKCFAGGTGANLPGTGHRRYNGSPGIWSNATGRFYFTGQKNLYYKEYKGYNHEFKEAADKSHLLEVILEATRWILQKREKI